MGRYDERLAAWLTFAADYRAARATLTTTMATVTTDSISAQNITDINAAIAALATAVAAANGPLTRPD